MLRHNHLLLYLFFVFVAVSSSLLGKILLMYPHIVWHSYTQMDRFSIHSLQFLANHRFMGIILAAIGFILLCYLSFLTAYALACHWQILQKPIRLFLLGWIILLGFSGILNSALLLHISEYLLLFSILILFLSLLCSYFWYTG
ncbi:hypothetical protein SAMN02745975_02479 [Geosporobacter subterraneus DSM 17957]|uniref:Uncharacterized protein n=1 Tax=Geosporobacter subterraneus DSM 17957 TaxID=1121919 RepID=A0A1M6KRW2_9FIRM|nr:hypothetical protein SAMN02745975_02479 [Geosporobacter subterraneus DSM 17957]